MIRIFLKLLAINYLFYLAFAQISIKGGCQSFDCCKDEFIPLPIENVSKKILKTFIFKLDTYFIDDRNMAPLWWSSVLF